VFSSPLQRDFLLGATTSPSNLPKPLSLPTRSFHFPLPNSFDPLTPSEFYPSYFSFRPRVRAALPQPGRIAHLPSYNPNPQPRPSRTKKINTKSEWKSCPLHFDLLASASPAEEGRITTTTNFALPRMHKFSQKPRELLLHLAGPPADKCRPADLQTCCCSAADVGACRIGWEIPSDWAATTPTPP
jgi:hypothetical protein